ncbi:ABC transporter substrate-binding protein [Candidatus Babeliales bacterium]|nr:ABC transporter substrate-binding protein [Candidatus Babeliales bacterium]
MKRTNTPPIFNVLLLLAAFCPLALKAQKLSPNPAANEIVFGQSGTFSGSLGLYGNIIKNSIELCFRTTNEQGGVNGKMLRLESLEDNGDPAQAASNVATLRTKGIDMFLGSMGSRSIVKLLPQVEANDIALFFPWGSNAQLRNQKLSSVINGPGLLEPQIKALVDHIVNNVKQKKIAIFYADDDFSTSAKDDLVAQLGKHGIVPTALTSYNRFTMDIIAAAEPLIQHDPKLVICIATSMPTVRLIKHFFERGHYATTFFGIDSTLFVGNILQSKGIDFAYTSATPDPVTSQLPIAQQYRENLQKYMPTETPNILSFAYYLSATLIVDALKKLDGQITKEKIINQIETMRNYNLGGFMINFDASTRHAFGNDVSLIKG